MPHKNVQSIKYSLFGDFFHYTGFVRSLNSNLKVIFGFDLLGFLLTCSSRPDVLLEGNERKELSQNHFFVREAVTLIHSFAVFVSLFEVGG